MPNNDPWVVCPDCNGEGKHTLHGIAIPMDEFQNEWHPDEQEAYLRGDYDTVCPTCNGRTTIKSSEVQDYHDRLQEAAIMRMESGLYFDH